MDFTINTYKNLLNALLKAGYAFQTFSEFLEKPANRAILLRHDVDARKLNSLQFAKIQHALGVRGTYYFRMVPQSYDPGVIRKIAGMGHEIGYHYEDMDFARRKLRAEGKGQKTMNDAELIQEAIRIFEKNLKNLRKLYPVKTICMHGSPRSRYDNKAVWKKYNYRDFGILGEPYFDIDFREVFYLTDTGRRWDGNKVSVRDKVASSRLPDTDSETKGQPASPNAPLSFHSTHQIVSAARQGYLPDRIMFTFHPQRWTNKPFPWMWELVFQNAKNLVKYYVVRNQGGSAEQVI